MPDPTAALYVRLPHSEYEKLGRAAEALSTNKKALVTTLVAHYVDPDSDAGLDRLRTLSARGRGAGPGASAGAAGPARRVTVELPEQGIAVGHHRFTPSPPPDVLTAAQAAELLQVAEGEIARLAEAGALPGRRIGEEWRFARAALLEWLAGR